MSMSGGDGNGDGGGVRRGDIVWVRVQYPHKWWPALVVSSDDDIGILVSFFDHNIDTNPRTCFIEPEVLPFEDAFPSLISPRHNTAPRCDTFRALLHSALKLLCQRLLSGLRSRFQKKDEVIGGSGPRFDPGVVLRFVLEAAVSPWVDPPRLLDAIRVVAQVQAFRAHSSIHHMRLCTEQRQTPPIGGDNNVKQQNTCSSLGQKIHSNSVIQEFIASGDCLVEVEGKESKDCNQHVAACSEFNSKVGQQPKSKTHVPVSSTSTSLFMKFPKNFNLPSKEQLIKRISVFGSIDSSRTRVFCYTGSAKVAFFQHGDAVAACRYAGKMVWFGEANVRFWLDPFEHKRSESKLPPSAAKPMGPPLKSCLKKSSSLKQENRKEHHRVRF